MVGAGSYAYEQALKWATYRHQFQRPIADFAQIQEKLARMASWNYAMEAMLYMTTGFLDRGDTDIMVETAICKVFCSDHGWKIADDCVQIMGGESYMTENEIERLWRDSRINRIVEGANEVMGQFICNYGAKPLLESMLEIKNAPMQNITAGMRLGAEVFLGIKRNTPMIKSVDPSLAPLANRVAVLIREFSHEFKRLSAEMKEQFATDHLAQSRLADIVIRIHALICSLSKLNTNIENGLTGSELEYEQSLVDHLFSLFEHDIEITRSELRQNCDATMKRAAKNALNWSHTLPNVKYVIPESTPDASARGQGKQVNQEHIQSFGEGTVFDGEPT